MFLVQQTVWYDPPVMNSFHIYYFLGFFFLILFENGSGAVLRVSAFGYVGNEVRA